MRALDGNYNQRYSLGSTIIRYDVRGMGSSDGTIHDLSLGFFLVSLSAAVVEN